MKWRIKGEYILRKERIYSKNKCTMYFQSGREPARADSEPGAEQPSLLLLVWLLGRQGGGARVRVRRVRRLPGEQGGQGGDQVQAGPQARQHTGEGGGRGPD